MIAGLSFGLLAGPALADSASFSVGVTVVKKGKPPKSALHAIQSSPTPGARRRSRFHGRAIAKLGARRGMVGIYWFTARKGNGLFNIAVSARTGAIVEVTPA